MGKTTKIQLHHLQLTPVSWDPRRFLLRIQHRTHMKITRPPTPIPMRASPQSGTSPTPPPPLFPPPLSSSGSASRIKTRKSITEPQRNSLHGFRGRSPPWTKQYHNSRNPTEEHAELI